MALERVIQKLFGVEVAVVLTRPDEQFGDFAANVALQLGGKLHKNPREVAMQIVQAVKSELGAAVADVTVAGQGFINVTLSDAALAAVATQAPAYRPETYKNQNVVAEYSDPNPFKVLHAGHLYTSVVGDALANLFEIAGGEVHRVNFGGDVGLHVAKTLWAIVRTLGGEDPARLSEIVENGRSEWMAKCYVEGTAAYEDDETAKAEIIELNKRVYALQAAGDHDSPLAHIYWTCRQWSYDYFNTFYARIGTTFEKYYPESEVAGLGLKTVREQLKKGVYKESDGAVVFVGEPFGLHTRVFVNSHGIPTYEAKDVGVLMQKWHDYHFDRSVVITGNDIAEYMKVVLKSVEQFEPNLVARTTHLTHGNVKLAGGVKMSSRRGNFLRAADVLDIAAEASANLTGQDNEQTALAAVKYSFLKNRIGGDIIFDPAESVSLEGNSGPYLQYAHARARSIVHKAENGRTPAAAPAASGYSAEGEPESQPFETLGSKVGPQRVNGSRKQGLPPGFEFEPAERSLARKISEYPEVLEHAAQDMLPHYICTYLYELAQVFNRFYEHNRVLEDPRQSQRLTLVAQYADTLQAGLKLLGITAPDRL